jgi:hypothetical protein
LSTWVTVSFWWMTLFHGVNSINRLLFSLTVYRSLARRLWMIYFLIDQRNTPCTVVKAIQGPPMLNSPENIYIYIYSIVLIYFLHLVPKSKNVWSCTFALPIRLHSLVLSWSTGTTLPYVLPRINVLLLAWTNLSVRKSQKTLSSFWCELILHLLLRDVYVGKFHRVWHHWETCACFSLPD